MSPFPEFALTVIIALMAALIAAAFATHLRLSLSPRAANALFLVFALTYLIIFGALSLLRHESFHSGGFDLGIFDQNIWNSLHGNPFQNTIAIESPILLGQHFSLLLMSLVPLYALWADARTLLIVQTILLAFTALPLYWYARREIGHVLAAILIVAFYLFPSLQYVNLFEFHEVAIAMPLLSLALFFFMRGRQRPFLVCLMLALLVKEEIGFIVAAFGVLLFIRRSRALGAALVVLGVTWAVGALLFVIPQFRDPVQGQTYQYVDRYLYLGKTVPEIVTTAVTQPGLVISHLFVPSKIEFVLQLLVPLAFLPFIGGEIALLALPTLGYLLLGDNSFQNSIHFQYTALLIPFVFYATVLGLKRLARVPAPAFAALLLVGSLANYYFQSAGPLARQFDPTQYVLTPHVQLGHQLLDQIPANASVMADSNLVPHLSDRRYVYQTSVVPDLRQIDYLLADTTLPLYTEYKWIWDDILPSPFFQTIANQDGYILKKRATVRPDHPLDAHFGDEISLLGVSIDERPAQRDANISLVLTWRADRPIRRRYAFFVHLLDAKGNMVSQDDREPANGWFRTDHWNPGDITPDRYTLHVPSDIPPGDYMITAGLYTVQDQQPLGNEVFVGNLHVD